MFPIPRSFPQNGGDGAASWPTCDHPVTVSKERRVNSFWAAGYQEGSAGQASGHGVMVTDGSWLGLCHEAVTNMSVGAAVTLTA